MFAIVGVASKIDVDAVKLQTYTADTLTINCDNFWNARLAVSYPTTSEGMNLLTIPYMRELFNCKVGLSDHALGIGAAVVSVALGAAVIEKHFTLSGVDGGVDSAFSMEPEEMAQLVRECETVVQALGHVIYEVQEQEKQSLQFRRSLYIFPDMKKV